MTRGLRQRAMRQPTSPRMRMYTRALQTYDYMTKRAARGGPAISLSAGTGQVVWLADIFYRLHVECS